MSLLNLINLGGGGDRTDRVDTGEGTIHERTLEIGQAVLVIANIGTMAIVDPERDHRLTVIGGIVALVGLAAMSAAGSAGGLLILVGGGMIVFSLMRPLEYFLSIGSCDGYRLNIVSKNRAFLRNFRTLLRDKIDHDDRGTGTVNISAGTISGSVAIGRNSGAFTGAPLSGERR